MPLALALLGILAGLAGLAVAQEDAPADAPERVRALCAEGSFEEALAVVRGLPEGEALARRAAHERYLSHAVSLEDARREELARAHAELGRGRSLVEAGRGGEGREALAEARAVFQRHAPGLHPERFALRVELAQLEASHGDAGRAALELRGVWNELRPLAERPELARSVASDLAPAHTAAGDGPPAAEVYAELLARGGLGLHGGRTVAPPGPP